MSQTLGIRINHMSRELRPLIDSGAVSWKVAHVLGFRKCARIYYLNEKGRKEAERVIESIKDVIVTLTDEFGNVERPTLEKAFEKMGGKKGYLELLCLRGIEQRPGAIISRSSMFPEQEGFFGRKDEIAALSRWLRTERPDILVLYGIAGIGKTSLVSMFVRGLKDRKLFYLKIHEWDSVHGVLDALGNALAGWGDERLQAHLKDRSHEDMTNISFILRDALSSCRPLLIFDDVWTASKELWRVISLLCDTVTGSGMKMILIF